uniref:F-box domain-containing protein n=1 Tax=Parascaris univalens TaxID=6257 RepID=A0A915C1Q2_PARUN
MRRIFARADGHRATSDGQISVPLSREEEYSSDLSNESSDLEAQDDDFLQPNAIQLIAPITDRSRRHLSRGRRKKRQERGGVGTGARPKRHQLLAPISSNARTHPTITAKQNQQSVKERTQRIGL